MEKNEGSPEKSSSERDLRRRSPRRRPSSGNLPAGGSSSSSNAPEGQQNGPPLRVNQDMIRPSILMAIPGPPRPRPTRFIPAPPRVNVAKRVSKPISGKTHSKYIGRPSGGPGMKKDNELASRALSSSWTFSVPSYKGKAKLRELIERKPRCTTCGKTYPSWNGLFSHLRSHADCKYLAAFPPARDSNVSPQNGFRGMDLGQQKELVDSLVHAATVVSAMLDPVENDMQIGECSEAGTSSEPPPLPSSGVSTDDQSNPDENRRSLRNDGLLLDLNAPPQDSDSELEDPK